MTTKELSEFQQAAINILKQPAVASGIKFELNQNFNSVRSRGHETKEAAHQALTALIALIPKEALVHCDYGTGHLARNPENPADTGYDALISSEYLE